MRADALLDTGDLDGAATWREIIRAIETLQGRLNGVAAPALGVTGRRGRPLAQTGACACHGLRCHLNSRYN